MTVNLAPADTKKEGPVFDLAIAVATLAASEQIVGQRYKDYVFLGELSLDGGLRHINGVMPIIISAMQEGFKKFVLPSDNAAEASYIEGIDVYAFDRLNGVAAFLNGESQSPVERSVFVKSGQKKLYGIDFFDVKGQTVAKRALEIAVAGGHNVLLIGPPGGGKTMLAKCVPTIMPDMTFEEAIEVTKIHSVAGILDKTEGIVSGRPFRTPHHSTTVPALVGGGAKAKPGEVSLASGGVLFLDELPEYSRNALETLRQPLEDRTVSIARVAKTAYYPANFMLIASMNPCPCGNYGSKTQQCRCTPMQIHNYLSRLSGPLMDRIDLQIEVDSVTYDEYRTKSAGETSKDIKQRVESARGVQRQRYGGVSFSTNAEMGERQLREYCAIDGASERLLERAYEKLNLTTRGTTRILKVARTIADLEGESNILAQHIAEAIQYRQLDRRYYV